MFIVLWCLTLDYFPYVDVPLTAFLIFCQFTWIYLVLFAACPDPLPVLLLRFCFALDISVACDLPLPVVLHGSHFC